MKQGVVVQIKDDFAVVMTKDHSYTKINKKNNMTLHQEIFFFEEDLYHSKHKEGYMKKKLLVAATVAALFLISVIGYNLMPSSAYALISIDINPSLQIEIDKDYVVTKIITLNDDGKSVINDDMVGKDVHDVIKEIVQNAEIEKFLNDTNNNILISSAILDEKAALDAVTLAAFGEELEQFLSSSMKVPDNVHIIYIESDLSTAEKSLSDGVTLGRLELAKITKDSKPLVNSVSKTIEAIEDVDMSVYEVEADDDLVESVKTFLNKLETAKNDSQFGTSIQAFLNSAEVAKFNSGTATQAETLALLKSAKLLWKPVMSLYQKTWALAQNDDSDDDHDEDEDDAFDSEDLDDLRERLQKLTFVTEPSTVAGISVQAWATQTLATLDTMSITQLQEVKSVAKAYFMQYKDAYNKIWSDDDDDEDEADAETSASITNEANSSENSSSDSISGASVSDADKKENDDDEDEDDNDNDNDDVNDNDDDRDQTSEAIKEINKALSRLQERFGTDPDVVAFVTQINAQLQTESPDYKQIEKAIEAKYEALKEALEDQEDSKDDDKDQSSDDNSDDDDDEEDDGDDD